jgi:type IV secretory pathway TrbD component
MTTRVYPIHRAIGRPVVFKGFKGHYIILAAIALIADLLLFVILYICGVAPWFCIVLTFALGGAALGTITRFSHRYGPYGLQRRMAAKRLPRRIRITSRQVFLNLKNIENYVQENGRSTAEDRILRTGDDQ